MRTTVALFATALILGAIRLWSPFGGRALAGNSLDQGFGFVGLVVLVIATAYGIAHGPSARSITLLIWSIVCFLVSVLVITRGGYVPEAERGISINAIAFALGTALFILAIEEGIRGRMDSRRDPTAAESP
jgi:hypothetical protein